MMWHDIVLVCAILAGFLLVTPVVVRGVEEILLKREIHWEPTPRSTRAPVWRWLTDEGIAWVLCAIVALIPLLLAFGL